MQHFSREQLLARWDETNDLLREAVFSDVNESILDAIAEKFRFSDSQRADTAYLCLLVFMGFVPYRSVMQALQDEFRLDPTTALSLYQEIDVKLFEPIRKDIEDNYLKFKVGVVDEARVQKPDVISEVNLKTAQPEGMVNLKKEDAGPKILAVGGSGPGAAYTPPAPRPPVLQETDAAFGPSIIQKKQDVVAAPHAAIKPAPSPTDKDIFSLSTKDLWGIESENIVTSRRMMGQPQVPPMAPPQTPAPAAGAPEKNALPTTEKKENILPVVEDSLLPETLPEPPRPIVSKPQQPEEKKAIVPPLPVVPPPPPVSAPPIVPPPVSRPQETPASQNAPQPSPVINPTISVNVQIAPQDISSGQFTASAPLFGGASPAQPIVAQPVQASGQPVPQARPMQWAAPAQPARQPDVVVEVRQTQENKTVSVGGVSAAKPAENESLQTRPMKMAPLAQSTPSTAAAGDEGVLAARPMTSSGRQPEIKKPLDPNEVVDIGPVIIHKREDPSVVQMQSGAQYRDLSSGGFSRNFSAQAPHPSAAPSVADVQVPVSPAGSAQTVGISTDKPNQSLAPGYGAPVSAPTPPRKKGFFSFFGKS